MEYIHMQILHLFLLKPQIVLPSSPLHALQFLLSFAQENLQWWELQLLCKRQMSGLKYAVLPGIVVPKPTCPLKCFPHCNAVELCQRGCWILWGFSALYMNIYNFHFLMGKENKALQEQVLLSGVAELLSALPGDTRSWEGTASGQVTQTSQSDVPHHVASHFAIKAGGKKDKWGGCWEWRCLSFLQSVTAEKGSSCHCICIFTMPILKLDKLITDTIIQKTQCKQLRAGDCGFGGP